MNSSRRVYLWKFPLFLIQKVLNERNRFQLRRLLPSIFMSRLRKHFPPYVMTHMIGAISYWPINYRYLLWYKRIWPTIGWHVLRQRIFTNLDNCIISWGHDSWLNSYPFWTPSQGSRPTMNDDLSDRHLIICISSVNQ